MTRLVFPPTSQSNHIVIYIFTFHYKRIIINNSFFLFYLLQTFMDGDALELKCKVIGEPKPTIKWFRYTMISSNIFFNVLKNVLLYLSLNFKLHYIAEIWITCILQIF